MMMVWCYLISMQVNAAAAPGKGGEYQPTFADDLLLTFFWSKMVEVSSISFLPSVKPYTMLCFDVLTSFRSIKE